MAKRSEVPVGMRKVHGRFERWRKSHVGRQPIPEGLWRAATELANEHGVCRTAEVLHLEYGKLRRQAAVVLARQHGLNLVAHPLRLDYTQLKKRLGGVVVVASKRASVVISKPAKSAAAASFVELIASPTAAMADCLIEFESVHGSKIRIQWTGSSAPDWAGLFRAWREADR
jgi:hypothetical protein